MQKPGYTKTMKSQDRFLVVLLCSFLLTSCQSIPRQEANQKIQIGVLLSREDVMALGHGDPRKVRFKKVIEGLGGEEVHLIEEDGLSEEDISTKLASLGGLIVPGGIDLDPRSYHEEPGNKIEPYNPHFDDFEFKVVKLAHQKQLPILAVCRGMQLMNVYYGGSLYQDLPSEFPRRPASDERVIHRTRVKGESLPTFHSLKFKKESLLEKFFGRETATVNSYHHQGVKKLGDSLEATAISSDGLIEAFQGTGSQFVLGVQFHPEIDPEKNAGYQQIFQHFYHAALRHHQEVVSAFVPVQSAH